MSDTIREYGVDWDKIAWLLSERGASISYGRASGCLCGSCNTYRIEINDDVYTGDTLREAVDEAMIGREE